MSGSSAAAGHRVGSAGHQAKSSCSSSGVTCAPSASQAMPTRLTSPDGSLMRHNGRELGIVLNGQLGVKVGFEDTVLGPGDSIAFDSTIPHRLFNKGDVPVQAVWFVVGRGGDARSPE